ncbi:MAG: DUF202 domain-containing protein [Oscillatoriaceae cyanobacterium Prado104]|jgi:putative membrane protein|nr:DUF202 domain-containing protein [Oscillatoriaceae cyanobacterium Prado104]
MTANEEKRKQQYLSRAIDRSANERTFLAWMRAAIALMGFGVVTVRLRVLQLPVQYRQAIGWKLGLIFCLVGLATVLISTCHYFAVKWRIDDNAYEPPDGMVWFFSCAVALLGIGVIYSILASALSSTSAFIPD